MEQNRPRGREKNVIGGSAEVKKRGSGLGTGRVGSTNRPGGGSNSGKEQRAGAQRASSSARNGTLIHSIVRMLGIKKTLILLAILLVLYLLFGSKLGNQNNSSLQSGSLFGNNSQNAYYDSGSPLETYAGSNWQPAGGKLDTSVAPGTRSRFTEILGSNQDTVTLMVYMCGTDLESKHGMATADLQEMLNADMSDKVNIIVFTGGCKKWQNGVISNSKNQIYQVKKKGLVCLEKDYGSASMTDPDTLSGFIGYCVRNYPANRKCLIFWDHGGGSLSGFGYDEKHQSSGSMDLAEIDRALKSADTKFDFIGFDACLMATLENGLMLSKYADYMIASEETEPGVGWYYTNWLTALSKNTSMPTIEIGKRIVDDFVEVCDRKCNGQKTTLSVVDLAELETTVPQKLTAFSTATKEMIQGEQYRTVSNARYQTREFAQSSKIDQVDLVHLAENMNNAEGRALRDAVLGAVKYNRTSSNMTHANGISIYFPYKKVGKVDAAVSSYRQIGMDAEYTKCIQEFASMEVGGQVYAGESGSGVGGSSLLGSILSGFGNELGGLDLSSLSFLKSASGVDRTAYFEANSLDSAALIWTKQDGKNKLILSEKQWALVQNLELNVFYDDGQGYIDLGLDNVFEFDASGNLIGDFDGTWLSINGQPVAYYHMSTVEEGSHYSVSGYVPVMLNGNRAELILTFDDANPEGYIAGARPVYGDGETEAVAKNMIQIGSGDRLEFLCDYYSYDGSYQDSYYLGEPMVLGDSVEIGNMEIGRDKAQAMYRLTDIYQQIYWTDVVPK